MDKEKPIIVDMTDYTRIELLFPTPVYHTHKKSGLDASEKKDIKDIIEEGMVRNIANSTSQNSRIFDTRLYNLKEFCEEHIKIYVENIIKPIKELEFYITQSWLNITKLDETHHKHSHPNSIISGVFYITTVEDDKITLFDPNIRLKEIIKIEPKERTALNSNIWFQSVNAFDLILFPSWLEHGVTHNEKATKDRISISFNIFASGALGKEEYNNQLIL